MCCRDVCRCARCAGLWCKKCSAQWTFPYRRSCVRACVRTFVRTCVRACVFACCQPANLRIYVCLRAPPSRLQTNTPANFQPSGEREQADSSLLKIYVVVPRKEKGLDGRQSTQKGCYRGLVECVCQVPGRRKIRIILEGDQPRHRRRRRTPYVDRVIGWKRPTRWHGE